MKPNSKGNIKMVKIIKLTLLVFLGLLLTCGTSFANGEIKIFHLQNGQTVIIKEVHANPIVTVDTWVKTGSINENPKNNGVSHFLEHFFFKGTPTHKAGEADRILETKGAYYNAATSKDFTHFYTTIASQYAETAIDLQADMLLHAAIPPDELKKERKVVQEEIRRAADNPDSIMFDNMDSILFKIHPYKYTTLGPIKNIENIPRENILSYYHKWYIPANMTTIIVGDVNTAKVLKLVEEDFKNNSNNANNLKVTYPHEPYLTKSKEIVQKGNYNTGYLEIGFKTVPILDRKDNYALDLAASILVMVQAQDFIRILRKNKIWLTSISAGNFSYEG